MKVKVIRKFKDKYNKKIYPIGKVIEVTEERFEEIQKQGNYVEEETEEETEQKKRRGRNGK